MTTKKNQPEQPSNEEINTDPVVVAPVGTSAPPTPTPVADQRSQALALFTDLSDEQKALLAELLGVENAERQLNVVAGVYVVKHAQVGEWREGTEITDADLEGIDKDRLLQLGAIAPKKE